MNGKRCKATGNARHKTKDPRAERDQHLTGGAMTSCNNISLTTTICARFSPFLPYSDASRGFSSSTL